MAETSHNVRITATDEATPVLDGVNKKIDELAGKSSAAESAAGARLGAAGQRLGAISGAIDRQSTALAASSVNWQALGATIGRVGVIAVKTAALAGASAVAGSMAAYTGYRILAENAKGFLDSSILLRKDIDATESEYRSLTGTMLDMAAKSGLSSSTLLGIGAELGGMGAAVGDITTIVDQAITAHRALDMALGDSATKLYQTKNTWKFSNDELAKSVDIVAALDNASTASAGQIMDVMSRTSAFARENGISFANWAAITTAALESGLSPQIVGGTLQKAVTLMGSGAKDTKKFAAGLKMLGLNTKDFKNLRAKDDFGALVQLIEAAAKSPRGVDALNQMFGTQQASVLMSLQGNIDKLKEFRRIAYSPDTIGTAGRNAAVVAATTTEIEKRIANSIQVFRERIGEGAAELRNVEVTAWDKFLEFQLKEGSLGKQADAISGMFRRIWQEATGEQTLTGATSRIGAYFDELTVKSEAARKMFGEPAPAGGWLDTVGEKLGQIIGDLAKLAGDKMDASGLRKDSFDGKDIWVRDKGWTDIRQQEIDALRELSDIEKRRLGLNRQKQYFTKNPADRPVTFSGDVIDPKEAEALYREREYRRAEMFPGGDYYSGGLTFDRFRRRFVPLDRNKALRSKDDWFGDRSQPGTLFDPRPMIGAPYPDRPAFPMPRARPAPGASVPPSSGSFAPPAFGPPTTSFAPSGGAPSGPPVMQAPTQPTTVNLTPTVQAPVTVNPVTTINVYAQTVAGDMAGRVSGALKGASGAYGATTSDAARRAIMNTPTGPGN